MDAPASSRSPLLALGLTLAAGAVQNAIYIPLMPERIATHFDGAGRPNGFMTPGGLLVFQALVLAVVIGAGLLPVLLLRYVSPAYVNLPNKDYWFAPERRQASVARLTGLLLWMLPITVGFLVAVDQLVFETNLAGGSLSTPGLLLAAAALLGAIAIWTVRLLRAFPRPPEAQR